MFEDLAPPSETPAEPHRALYLRWRPRRFEDVVGQEHVTRTLRNAVRLGRAAHAYLFTGPRGTGKTTVARILYRALNCEHPQDGDPDNTCALCRAALAERALDLVEIDAASNRRIDDIRDLRDKIAYRPGEGRYRLYILDEAHQLTNDAWDALLKTLEEPPPHAIFVLATTAAHEVPPTIVSRCQRFDFRRIPYQLTREQLARVAHAEGLQVDPAVIERLALVARGGLRDALSLLDQLSAFAVGTIDMSVARAALSLPSIEAVHGAIDGMTRHDPAAVMAVISDAAEGGADLRLFADELVANLRALLLLRAGADARLTDELPADEVAWLRERAPAWSIGALMQLVQTLSEALARTRDAQQFQIQTEVALLAACDVEPMAAVPRPVISSAPVVNAQPTRAAPAPASPSSPTAAERPASPAAPLEVATVAVPTPSPLSTDRPAPSPVSPTAAQPSAVEDPVSPARSGPAPGGSGPDPPARSEISRPVSETELGGVGAQPPTEEPGEKAGENPPLSLRQGEGGRGGVGRSLEERRSLADRWPDVVDQVKRRNNLVASILGSAQPIAIEDSVLVVAFSSDFNRKAAEKSTNRQLIEAAFERVYGASYRLRCTLATADDGTGSLLDDPVINFAQRTFGGQPKRLPAD